MEEGLKEAAHIYFNLEWDEMKALQLHREAIQLHRVGIRDTIMAYEYASEADRLDEYVFQEEKNAQELYKDVKEKENEAQIDKRESTLWGMSSFEDYRKGTEYTIKGVELARQAQEENERSEMMMNCTAEQEKEGKEKLLEAQAALTASEEIMKNNTEIDKGICKWASLVCKAIHSIENTGGNRSLPVQATDMSIKANKDMQDALQNIRDAQTERSQAIELHRIASMHTNESTEILFEAGVFKYQSKIDLEEAIEKRTDGDHEEDEAIGEENKATNEENDIALKEYEIQNDIYDSAAFVNRVMNDRNEERIVEEKLHRDLMLIKFRENQLEEKTNEATHHVARAGWEALVASVAGGCLLVVVITRIVGTFRYQRPLLWVVRDEPYFIQDMMYLFNHVCIFLLSMGYIAELLKDFHNHTNIARVGITVIFALVAAVLQVTLLHLIPSFYGLFRDSTLHSSSIRLLLRKVVLKKGVIIALVSAIEMLLCWCWVGTMAFTQVDKLNTYVVWFFVLLISVCYTFHIQNHKYAVADDLSVHLDDVEDQSSNHNNGQSKNNESVHFDSMNKGDESDSLLPACIQGSATHNPGSVQGSCQGYKSSIQGSKISVVSSSSMRSIQLESVESDEYGSLSNIFRAHLSTSPLEFSWESELEKIRLLFEILIASFAIWIIRRDLALIRKLSPLTAGLVWGALPLWILNIFLVVIVATGAVMFAMKKIGKDNLRLLRGA